MAGTEMKNVVLIALVVLIILFVVHQFDPSFFGLFGAYEGFADVMKANGAVPSGNSHGNLKAGQMASNGKAQMVQNADATTVNGANKNGNPQNVNTAGFADYKKETPMKAGVGVQGSMPPKNGEGFADLSAYEGPAEFGSAEAPAGCYPRDQLTPSELLPRDMNSIWAEQNPMGPGSLKGKNFLSAGALIGVNTVGQSLRNANLQIRSEPPNPQVPVSIFNQSTISPDISHRPLEVGP
jgi:hypothetical protein